MQNNRCNPADVFNQKGAIPVFVLLAIIGIIAFIAISSFAPFKDKLFSYLYPKPASFAEAQKDYFLTYPLSITNPVYSLSINGNVNFQNSSSFIRVILISKDQKEYLVYESYPAISNNPNNPNNAFSIQNSCEETCVLNAVVPDHLRIEGNSSEIKITKVFSSNIYRGKVFTRKDVTTQADQIAQDARRIKQQADNSKIQKLNQTTRGKWTAGETSVSRMTYEQKKHLFSNPDGKPLDHLPNLQGFEYYKGGIFEIKTAGGVSTPPSKFPKSWDYRNFHGQNWMTPVKNQGGCNSCAIFAATAVVEANINLYLNQHLDLDLSEQDVLSCGGIGDCASGTYPNQVMKYFIDTGAIPESCFPYRADNSACNKCSNWKNDRLLMGAYTEDSGYSIYESPKSEEWIKEKLVGDGVISAGIYSWQHAMALVGWQTDEGETAWIFKNSWGADWGEKGYAIISVPAINIGPLTVLHLSSMRLIKQPDLEPACVDKDNDGYCNWGISESKPYTCPSSCKPQKDCNDADPTLTMFDSSYNCIATPTAASLSTPIVSIPGCMSTDSPSRYTGADAVITWNAADNVENIYVADRRVDSGDPFAGVANLYSRGIAAGNTSVSLIKDGEINADSFWGRGIFKPPLTMEANKAYYLATFTTGKGYSPVVNLAIRGCDVRRGSMDDTDASQGNATPAPTSTPTPTPTPTATPSPSGNEQRIPINPNDIRRFLMF